MDSRAYQNAQKVNRARALVRAGVAELDRQQRMQLFMELYEEAEAEPTGRQRSAIIMGPNGPVRVQVGVQPVLGSATGTAPAVAPYPTQEPAAGSLRADILRILSESTRPLRTREITELLGASRPGVTMPSVASAIWHFVQTGRVHKATDRKRDYYALDPKVLGVFVAEADQPLANSPPPNDAEGNGEGSGTPV